MNIDQRQQMPGRSNKRDAPTEKAQLASVPARGPRATPAQDQHDHQNHPNQKQDASNAEWQSVIDSAATKFDNAFRSFVTTRPIVSALCAVGLGFAASSLLAKRGSNESQVQQ